MYDPPWGSSEHALTNPYTRIDLPADVKRYLCELAALAEQVRKWEKETEAFAQFLVATAVRRRYLPSCILLTARLDRTLQ